MTTERRVKRKLEKQFEKALCQLPFQDAVSRYHLRKYVLEISVTICSVLEALSMSDRAKVIRPDLGLSVQGYYNYPHNIKIDIIRRDRYPIFHSLEEIAALTPTEEAS